MQIDVSFRSPTTHGGALVSLAGEFLAQGMPAIGTAVTRIDVDLLVAALPRAPRIFSVDEPEESRSIVDPYDAYPELGREHEAARRKGGALTFRRQAARVDIRIVSGLSALDVFGPEEGDPEVFARVAREIVAALDVLERRVKPSDDLDLPALLAHLRTRLDQLPATREELMTTVEVLAAAAQARWDAMSPWEVLDVDWSLYAPGARTLLDDPFYWDPADDEAPHGNDTGADLMATFLEQRPDDVMAFLEQQARAFGFASLAEIEGGDEYEHDFLVVAAAFAELKVSGSVTPAVRELALGAVERRAAERSTPATDLLRAALG